MEYTIPEIIKILFKRVWIIGLCLVLGTGSAFLISRFIIDEEFTASVSMYVIPNQDNQDIFESLSNLNYAQKVVNTYIVILKTNDFLYNVARTSGLNYSVEDLKKMITMNPVSETEIFEIHVTSKSPEDSLLLANTVTLLAPKKILEIKNADAVRAVDPASLPIRPSSPNILINTAIGFMLGIFSGIVTAFFLETLDKRVKDEEDLLMNYKVPVLGTIPVIEQNRGD